jgi:hypothetical protein
MPRGARGLASSEENAPAGAFSRVPTGRLRGWSVADPPTMLTHGRIRPARSPGARRASRPRRPGEPEGLAPSAKKTPASACSAMPWGGVRPTRRGPGGGACAGEPEASGGRPGRRNGPSGHLAPSKKKMPGEPVQGDPPGRGVADLPSTRGASRGRRAGARRSAGPFPCPGGPSRRPGRPPDALHPPYGPFRPYSSTRVPTPCSSARLYTSAPVATSSTAMPTDL